MLSFASVGLHEMETDPVMNDIDSTIKTPAVERLDDPDAGLDLQQAISTELSASIDEVENGGATSTLDEVADRLGLAS